MSYKLLKLNNKKGFITDQIISHYWNDEEVEKNKVFNVIDNGFEKIEKNPKYRALFDQVNHITNKYRIDTKGKKILSVASGTCWTESQWLKSNVFKKLDCVDISQHRIHKLAPFTMKHYGVKGEVHFLCGNVFDIDFIENKYDIIFMTQGFHHFEEPIHLLNYLKNILIHKGFIVIAGEPFYTNYEYHKRAIKHFIKYLINWKGYRRLRNFYPSWQDLFQPDYQKGDIHWSIREYDFIFNKSGFSNYCHDIHKSNLFHSFVLQKK